MSDVCSLNRFTQQLEEAASLRDNQKLLAAATLVAVLKMVNASDRVHNQVFDLIAIEVAGDCSARDINQLSAIIFEVVKPEV